MIEEAVRKAVTDASLSCVGGLRWKQGIKSKAKMCALMFQETKVA